MRFTCKSRVVTVLAAAFLRGAHALLAGIAAAQEPIRIGAFLSVTGPAAFLGDPEQKTLEMYVERINASGGVARPQAAARRLRRRRRRGQGPHVRQAAHRAGQGRRHRRRLDHRRHDGGDPAGRAGAECRFVSLAGAVVIIEPVKKWVFKTPHTDRMACEKIFADMRARKLTGSR